MNNTNNKNHKKFRTRLKNKIKKIFKIIGPGFITGSADIDPAGIGTYSIAAAQYGPLLLWLVPFQLPLMYAMQNMCSRIGLVSGKGLAANMKTYFPRPIVYGSICILATANLINIGTDIAMMAASLELILGFNALFWAIATTVLMLFLEIYFSYHAYSKILLVLASFLLSYAITAFLTTDNWLEILHYTITPYMQWDKEFILVVTGFIGITMSPHLYFWQASQELEEEVDHKSNNEKQTVLQNMPLDTLIGMFFTQLTTFFILLTCYFGLHNHGITHINSAREAAIALQPFAGNYATIIFALGIVGAGLLGIPVLASASAYALAELFEKPEGLSQTFHQARFFYGTIILSCLIGLVINFFDTSPVQALLYASVVNCAAGVPLAAFVVLLANNKHLMGIHKNGLFFNTLGIIAFLLMFIAAALTIASAVI